MTVRPVELMLLPYVINGGKLGTVKEKETITTLNQNYDKILEREWLLVSRFTLLLHY